tara:strand:+ start:2227 stop:2502 length:276 start_codon:yes stop_codon:yes gene_type:complete
VYAKDTAFNDVSAVYIMSKRTVVNDGSGSHDLLYTGESAHLRSRLTTHEKWPCAQTHGCNCVCVMTISNAMNRVDTETDLRNGYSTTCNDQ